MTELKWPDPPLADEVVQLRPWLPADLGFIVAACQDPEISRFSPVIPVPYTRSDASGWFLTQEPNRLAGNSMDFAVAEAASGRPLGAIGLHRVDSQLLTAETGYWLAPEARGHGYMTRAVRLLAGWVFDQLHFARLELRTDPANIASQRIAQRCGFRPEGHLRSNLVVLHSGRRRDSLVYGLLPGELAS